jgi:hypothetical protein
VQSAYRSCKSLVCMGSLCSVDIGHQRQLPVRLQYCRGFDERDAGVDPVEGGGRDDCAAAARFVLEVLEGRGEDLDGRVSGQVGSSDLREGRPWFDAADRRSGCGEISGELAGAAPNLQDPPGVGNPRELNEVVDCLGWVTRSRPIIKRSDAIEDPSLSCAALRERAGQRDAGGSTGFACRRLLGHRRHDRSRFSVRPPPARGCRSDRA